MLRSVAEANDPANEIVGVVFKELKSFPDNRGFFRELVRQTDNFFGDGFGQWSHSKMGQNTVKAWHFHHTQTDWWYVPLGLVHVYLYDNREESPTYRRSLEFFLGDVEGDSRILTSVIRIPPGVLHGLKVLSDTAHLFYITSHTYNPQDEGRLPFNTDLVPHSWGDPSELVVAENDKQTFIPPVPRVQLITSL